MRFIFSLPVFFILLFSSQASSAQQSDPWTAGQLMEPAQLNAILHNQTLKQPVVLDIGPAGVIKGARVIGPTGKEEGMASLKKTLQSLSKDEFVVIYCGCCPFNHCPNIRPAFRLLKTMGFSNARLLNLSANLKQDWIDKGYPLQP